MFALFRKYKSVVRFILVFVGVYLMLSLLYVLYLSWTRDSPSDVDGITRLVAYQSRAVLEDFNYSAMLYSDGTMPQLKLYVNDHYVARIIEGCNAMSILILFASFVVAFAQSLKKTLIFLFAGVVLLYAVNVVRIVILAIALYHYPEKEGILHGVVFPGIIYGMVFLLWMAWVRMLKPIQVKRT